MEYTKIKLRRDIQINWNRVNPVLESGEIGIITDINKFKIGDGITSFVLLPFATYNADELDSKFQNIQTQIDEIGGAELKERISAVEEKVEQNTNDITAIKGAGYLNSEQVNDIINGKDYATNTRVNEVENKIPSDIVTSAELQAVETIANSKTTLEEVNQQGFVKNSELATVAKTGSYNDLSDKPTIPEGVVVDTTLNENSDNAISNKAVATKINTMDSEIASKTTISEVEAKNFQTAEQVEQTITSKNYTTLDEVAQQGYAQNSDIPTDNNQLNNGAGYQTSEQVESAITAKGYTTISEVEGKGYQDSTQVEVAINAKEYVPKSGFATINSQSITDGGNIEIQGGGGAEAVGFLGANEKVAESQAIVDDILNIKEQINNVEVKLPNLYEEWDFTLDDGTVLKRSMYIQPKTNSFYIENVSTEDGEVSSFLYEGDFQYSYDGTTWQKWDVEQQVILPLKAGQRVYIRGNNTSLVGRNNIGKFSCNKIFNIGGDLTSLLSYQGNKLDLSQNDFCFRYFFKDTNLLNDASSLIIPSKILGIGTFNECFAGSGLKVAPLLFPAKKATPNCYYAAFKKSKIKKSPIFLCDEIGFYSFREIFEDSQLEEAPEIYASKIDDGGLGYAFDGCYQLKKAPIIPIDEYTDTQKTPFVSMVSHTSLTEIKTFMKKWNKNAFVWWTKSIYTKGTFYKPKELQVGDGEGQIPISTEENRFCGIPAGWDIVDF